VLVLTRRAGERIEIGEDIVLEIVEVRQGQVRLGIHAPARVPIFREEVARQIREENRRAAARAAAPIDVLVAKLRRLHGA